jgi:hypothetical protein
MLGHIPAGNSSSQRRIDQTIPSPRFPKPNPDPQRLEGQESKARGVIESRRYGKGKQKVRSHVHAFPDVVDLGLVASPISRSCGLCRGCHQRGIYRDGKTFGLGRRRRLIHDPRQDDDKSRSRTDKGAASRTRPGQDEIKTTDFAARTADGEGIRAIFPL